MRRLLALVILGIVLTACQAEATVTIEVDRAGAGAVTVALALDAAAADAIGGPDVLRLEDLAAAGWSIDGPVTTDDGATVAASKPFANPEQFAAVMSEIAGPGGVLRDFQYERRRTFGRTAFTIEGVADLSGGIESFGDEELASLLGHPVGWDPAALEAEIGRPLAEAFSLTIEVAVPGSTSAPGAIIDDGRAQWSPRLGGEAFVIRVEGRIEDRKPALFAGIAVAALGVLVLVSAVRAVGWLRRDRRSVPSAPARPVSRPRDDVRQPLLVLAWHGVVFTETEPLSGGFGPFCRARGSRVDAPTVGARYREATLGRLSAVELWSAAGVAGDPRQLNREYLSTFSLVPGLADMVAEMAALGWAVGAVANDLGQWNRMLRNRHRLDDLLAVVVASGEVGARVPSRAVFEAVRREAGLAFEDVVYVDRKPAHLDAARSLGMRTVLYWPDGHVVPGEHDLIRDLSELRQVLL